MGLHNLMLLAGRAFADEAAATEEIAEVGTMGLIGSFLPMILIVVVFYFLMMRPQRKKQKQEKEMRANLKIGDRVTTIGGIHGTIAGIKDDTLTIAVGADKVKIVMANWAIRSVDEVSIVADSESLI